VSEITEETNLLTLAKKPSVTAQTWRSVAECSTTGKQLPEKLGH